MKRKQVIVKRKDATVLRPKKLRSFNIKVFLEVAKRLENAIKKEEREYGSSGDNSAAAS